MGYSSIPCKTQDKARETTEKTKISVAIAGEQREIEKNCRLIGEWFINEYEGELPEGVQELADAVAASKARIAELEEQKNAIKVEHSEVSAAEPGMKICPVCGAESDSKFCPECGDAFDENDLEKREIIVRRAENGEKIGAERIKKLLENGDVQSANALLCGLIFAKSRGYTSEIPLFAKI